MDDDTHLSLGILAVCDSLDNVVAELRKLGCENSESFAERAALARKHAHAVLNRNHKATTEMEPDVCRCPEDQRPDCDCYGTCICTAP
jgi:hypothetical protein